MVTMECTIRELETLVEPHVDDRRDIIVLIWQLFSETWKRNRDLGREYIQEIFFAALPTRVERDYPKRPDNAAYIVAVCYANLLFEAMWQRRDG